MTSQYPFQVINPMLYAFCGKQFRLRTLQMLEKMIGRRLPLAKRSLLDRSGINSDSFRKKSSASHWPTNESHFYLSTRTSVSQKPSGTHVEERLLPSCDETQAKDHSECMTDYMTDRHTPCANISRLQIIFEPKPISKISKNSKKTVTRYTHVESSIQREESMRERTSESLIMNHNNKHDIPTE